MTIATEGGGHGCFGEESEGLSSSTDVLSKTAIYHRREHDGAIERNPSLEVIGVQPVGSYACRL